MLSVSHVHRREHRNHQSGLLMAKTSAGSGDTDDKRPLCGIRQSKEGTVVIGPPGVTGRMPAVCLAVTADLDEGCRGFRK
jgi:hypothetical protein